jgi:hypothetical protein
MAGSLEALAPDLWVAARPLKLIVGDIGTRMTVIRLGDGTLFLHSPVQLDGETRTALDAIGEVRWVVAPSKVHHFFVGDYLKVYPAARAYAAPGLAEKRKDLRFEAVLGDTPPPEWRDAIDQHLVRGIPTMSEVVFLHRASRTLLLTDLAFNVAADRTAGARLFYWLVGAGGRFGPHRLVRTMIRDHTAARSSIARILEWDFDRIIVTHGNVLESAGRQHFAAAFAFL